MFDKCENMRYNKDTKEREVTKMDHPTYSVIVYATRPKTAYEYRTTLKFFGRFAAVYMAKQYYACEDVSRVDVLDNSTGELIYGHSYYEEYEADTD